MLRPNWQQMLGIHCHRCDCVFRKEYWLLSNDFYLCDFCFEIASERREPEYA